MAGKNYTRIKDLVTGSEGSAYITIDGQNRYFFELSKVEANIEFTVIAKKLLGHRMKQHKVVAAEGKGSITMYNVSPAAMRALSVRQYWQIMRQIQRESLMWCRGLS